MRHISDFIKRMYSQFKIETFDCSAKNDITINKSLLNFLDNYNFITYQIHESTADNSLHDQIVDVVFCVEKVCYIINSISKNTIYEKLNSLKSVVINSIEKNNIELTQEIFEVYQYIGKQNFIDRFHQLTIYPIIAYLIRRFYYPSYFFKDPSFFIFYTNPGNNLQVEKPSFYENEFIILRSLASKSNVSTNLVLHKKSLNLLVIKKIGIINGNKYYDREVSFCKKYSCRFLMNCYGFLKDRNEIVGFVYEFMSNGSLLNYINQNKGNISIFASYNIAIRIILGIDYLHSKNLIHRDLKPSNILLNHNNLAYLSDFETIRTFDDTNELSTHDFASTIYSSPEQNGEGQINYSSDIYSFGMILYLIFEKKEVFNTHKFGYDEINELKMNEKFPKMSECYKDIENIFRNCVKYKQNERLTIEEIEAILLKSDTHLFNKKNINISEYNQNAGQYFFDLSLLEIQTKKKPNIAYLSDKIYNILALVNNQSSSYIYIANKLAKSQKNAASAIHFYELAANFGQFEAFYQLGIIYLKGNGVPKDIAKAIYYFNEASKRGNSEADFILGDIYLNIGNKEKAIENYQKAAHRGNSFALLKIGDFYYQGIEFKKDLQKAKENYELAASQKNDKALIKLGDMYFKGEGVKIDYIKARYFYMESMQFNNLVAPYRIGTIYYNGLGVDVSIKKAIKFFKICTYYHFEQGYLFFYAELNRSINDLAIIYITEKEFINQNTAAKYFKKASSNEYCFAWNNYGLFYEFFNDEFDKAESQYNRASNAKFALSDFNLARLYYKKNNKEKSLEYYIKFSDHENEPLLYLGQKIYDDRLDRSISYISCIVNLKLTLHFLFKNEYIKARKYFVRTLSKQINISKNKFYYSNSLKNDLYSFLIELIFNNYEDQNLFTIKLSNDDYKNEELYLSNFLPSDIKQKSLINDKFNSNGKKENQKIQMKSSFKDENNKPLIEEDENVIILNPDEFFNYAIKDAKLFINTVYEIIVKMSKVLFTPPYQILFGRIKITEKKYILRDINHSFYEGIGTDI